jgi:hypothetical protein
MVSAFTSTFYKHKELKPNNRVFAIPTIIGAVVTPLFWFIYREIDEEDYRMAHDITAPEEWDIAKSEKKI